MSRGMAVADLFCGCGGFSLGFDMVGFDVVFGLDSWRVACESFQANFPKAEVVCKDALEIDHSEIPDADIIIGGPPCQGFSIARAGIWDKIDKRDFDTSLVEWFLKVVEAKRPKYWIMENVPAVADLISAPKVKVLEMWRYGVPQMRRRMFAGVFEDPRESPVEVIFPAVLASENKGGVVERRMRHGRLGIRLGSVFRRRSFLPEAMLVQTFPLDYILAGNLTERYMQIGNAVPPLMAYRLAEAIKNLGQKRLDCYDRR